MSPSASFASRRFDQRVRALLTILKDGATIRCEGEGTYYLAGDAGAGLPSALVETCLAEDWLEWSGEDLAISETGLARLRRAGAGEDSFREQHQLRADGERELDGTRRPVLLNDGESPLGWLKSRKDRNGRPLISDEQFEAGERLRADHWFAHLSPRVTSNWSALAPSERARRGASSSAAALRDEVIAAKERVMRALMAVGPEVSGILVDVCCELKGLEDAEKVNGWPQRAGKVVLQIALTRLARHYGLIRNEERQTRQGGLRHWGAADYRPTIDGGRSDQDDDP